MIRPRILLADDHAALLEGVEALLAPRFDVVGNVSDGATLVSEGLRLCPDVIVSDITMPGLSGIDAVYCLREFASSARIVFLTIHSEEQFVEACVVEGRIGICRQGAHEDPLNSGNRSSAYRRVLPFSIFIHMTFASSTLAGRTIHPKP